MTDSIEQRAVARGAKFLDSILPGWYKRVNLNTLDMSDGTMCILGQAFGVRNEKSLAKEMYPEEFNDATAQVQHAWPAVQKEEVHRWGYRLARNWMIPSLLKKRGRDQKTDAEFQVLNYVCKGHNNRCEWAAEVAERLAQDKE